MTWLPEPGTDTGPVQAMGQPGDDPGSDHRRVSEPGWIGDFSNLSYEWRRLFSELFGTFLLVLAAAGAAVIQDTSGGQIGRIAEVTAPGLTVLAVILFMGAVSGACVRG